MLREKGIILRKIGFRKKGFIHQMLGFREKELIHQMLGFREKGIIHQRLGFREKGTIAAVAAPVPASRRQLRCRCAHGVEYAFADSVVGNCRTRSSA